VNLVASAVKGLSPDKVAVIDSFGKMLSRSEAENSLTGQQLGMRQNVETEMAAKIVQILEPAVGVGKVKPQVSVSMNFQQVEETQENYDPQKAVIVSSQKQSDTTTGATPVGGVVGVRPPPPPAVPTPGATVATEAAKPSMSGKSSEVVNYEISKSIRHIVNPVGKVERVSVAVVLDNQTETTTAADGKVSVKSTPRTPEEMKKYHDLVAAAIAFDMERGDQLIVENISFDGENSPESIAEPTFLEKQSPTILTGLRYIIIPIAFVVIYFLFIRPLQKSVMAGWVPVTAEGQTTRGLLRGGVQTPLTVKQLEARLASSNTAADMNELSSAADFDLAAPQGPSKIDIIRKRVIEQAKQDPETVARLVRVWLNEEKNR
jgi:flagellar M-ring protein FliF